MEQVRMCTFFSCKYAPWEFDSEIIIPSCILLEHRDETNRSDNFLVPVYVSEMETRWIKCDFPNLPWFTCLLLAISRDFFPQEVNLRTCGKNLTEPLDSRCCPVATIEILPRPSEKYHAWDAEGDVLRTYPGPKIRAPGRPGAIFISKRKEENSDAVYRVLEAIIGGVVVW